MYRPAEVRQKDWGEVYNFEGVRKGLRVQAARCMDCGVPFCQSSHGCPLGNIIPKWNDLIFNNNWKEALNQLLQTNNFPGELVFLLSHICLNLPFNNKVNNTKQESTSNL